MQNEKRILSTEQQEELLSILKSRFEKNMKRHETLEWSKIEAKLKVADVVDKDVAATAVAAKDVAAKDVVATAVAATAEKLWSLSEMERTGGEPDVVGFDNETGEFIFVDCSEESPKGRRSICYDREALESRKENRPETSAIDMADAIGIEILTEEQYRELQKLGHFDLKTSSWLKTPADIRKLGGAIFADFRYNTVFVYHNGAESYYGARGFRGSLRV